MHPSTFQEVLWAKAALKGRFQFRCQQQPGRGATELDEGRSLASPRVRGWCTRWAKQVSKLIVHDWASLGTHIRYRGNEHARSLGSFHPCLLFSEHMKVIFSQTRGEKASGFHGWLWWATLIDVKWETKSKGFLMQSWWINIGNVNDVIWEVMLSTFPVEAT